MEKKNDLKKFDLKKYLTLDYILAIICIIVFLFQQLQHFHFV